MRINREKHEINEYFLSIVKDIIENHKEFAKAFLCESGGHYENVVERYYERNINLDLHLCIRYGASRIVIISRDKNDIAQNYVAKIPFRGGFNYCREELSVYNNIKETYEEHAKYFAECWLVEEESPIMIDEEGNECSIPIYIMERADDNSNKIEKSSYEYWRSKGGEEGNYCPEDEIEEVINCFKGIYGEDIGSEIETLIDEMDISDIHTCNVGFVGDEPIIIDYAGYFG